MNSKTETKKKDNTKEGKVKKWLKKVCKFLTNVLKCLFFTNDFDESSQKYRKYMNPLRILIFICFFSFCAICISDPKDNIEIKKLLINSNWLKYSLVIIAYVLIRIYWDWIKKVWKFLQEDTIVHYIFLIMVPIGIIFFGYKLFFNSRPGIPAIPQELKNSIITTSDLNGFYASLFTAIAVIVAVFALIGWRRHKELEEKLEKFKKIEEKVDRLHKKKDLADWAKNAVAGPERSSITSFDIKYSKNEENKIKDIIATLSDEYTENGWLEVIYSKEIFKSRNNKERFRKSFNIFNFLIQRDMISNNQDISLEGVVYHFLGQLFWKYYIDKRDDFYKKNGSNVIDFEKWKKERIEDIRENDKIIKKDDEKKNVQEQSDNKNDTQIQNDKNAEISLIECLEISNKYYKKAFDIRERRNEKRDETLGNLAVVLIELAKIDKTNKEKCLKDAKNYLDKVVDNKEDTFTTYWDLARHYYYIDKTKKNGTIKDYLFKAIDKVKTIGQRDTILDGIQDEYDETMFPGDQELIEELKKRLDQKKYLKNEE